MNNRLNTRQKVDHLDATRETQFFSRFGGTGAGGGAMRRKIRARARPCQRKARSAAQKRWRGARGEETLYGKAAQV